MSSAGTRLAAAGMAVGVLTAVTACGGSDNTNTGGGASSGQSASMMLPGATVATPTQSAPFGAATYPTPPPTATALPAEVDVDRADPSSVAIAAARVWFGWNTRTDRSPYAAAVRATALMTPVCAQRITATPPNGSPDASYTALVTAGAVSHVSAVIGSEEHPADTATIAVRVVAVTQTFTPAQSVSTQPIPARHQVATVTMTRTDRGWALTDDGTGRCGPVIR